MPRGWVRNSTSASSWSWVVWPPGFRAYRARIAPAKHLEALIPLRFMNTVGAGGALALPDAAVS